MLAPSLVFYGPFWAPASLSINIILQGIMIPLKEKSIVQSNIHAETNQFTITASGKAFRTLVGSLYTNKIAAVVRELCSNAADAHVVAGIGDVPFDVHLPTDLNTEFYVRDYGNSMSHDFVMGFYVTLFYSDKTEDNSQMGLYGLGSKSPFAYTDSFNVECYVDNVLRQYVCYIDADDIPSVSFLGEKPTDQPNGTKIAFSAKMADTTAFTERLKTTAIAYKIPPNVVNKKVEFAQAKYQMDGVRIYDATAFGTVERTKIFITQGNVLYRFPSSTSVAPLVDILQINGSDKIVLNAPIGTFDVTPSREDIDLNAASEANLTVWAKETADVIVAELQAETVEASNRYERFEVFNRYSSVLKVENIKTVDDDRKIHIKAEDRVVELKVPLSTGLSMLDYYTLATETKNPKLFHSKTHQPNQITSGNLVPGYMYNYDDRNFKAVNWLKNLDVVVFVGLEAKIPRKIARLKNARSYVDEMGRKNAKIYYCFTEDLPRFVRLLRLTTADVYNIASIKDDGPIAKARPRANAVVDNKITATSSAAAIAHLSNNQLWITCSRGNVEDALCYSSSYGSINKVKYLNNLIRILTAMRPGLDADILGQFSDLNVVELTPKATEKILVANAGFIDNHVVNRLISLLGTELIEMLMTYNICHHVSEISIVARKIFKNDASYNNMVTATGYGNSSLSQTQMYVSIFMSNVANTSYPQLWDQQELVEKNKKLTIDKRPYTVNEISAIYKTLTNSYCARPDFLFKTAVSKRNEINKQLAVEAEAFFTSVLKNRLSVHELNEILYKNIVTTNNLHKVQSVNA